MVRLTTSSHRNLLLFFFNLLNEMFLRPCSLPFCPLLPECPKMLLVAWPSLFTSSLFLPYSLSLFPSITQTNTETSSLLSGKEHKFLLASCVLHSYFSHASTLPPIQKKKKKKVICYLCVTTFRAWASQKERDTEIDLISSRLSKDLMIVKRNRIDKEPLAPLYIY